MPKLRPHLKSRHLPRRRLYCPFPHCCAASSCLAWFSWLRIELHAMPAAIRCFLHWAAAAAAAAAKRVSKLQQEEAGVYVHALYDDGLAVSNALQ